MTDKPLTLKPHLEAVTVTAIAGDGVCTTVTEPGLPNIKRVTIMAAVSDPLHLFFRSIAFDREWNPEATILEFGLKTKCIGMPGMELAVDVQKNTGINDRAMIELDIWELKILALEMGQIELPIDHGSNNPLPLAINYAFLREMIFELFGYNGAPDPLLSAIFPPSLTGMHKASEAFCVGCHSRSASPAQFDYWKFTGWSPASFPAIAESDPLSVTTNAFAR